jgi:leucyl-tRNA synthetase
MDYNHKEIEAKWQKYWEENHIYKVENDTNKPKFYVLDMFPYPSGAGLHVGHPLGYIASDIVARYKKLKGFNVLHPIGFDSFGLPAEQYAIETGQHPAITTAKNIDTYKKQLRKIGFNYDWSREVQTSDPAYYKWTQWIFAQLFDAWYDYADVANSGNGKAKHIDLLIQIFEKEGNKNVKAACDEDTPAFSVSEWQNFSEKEKSNILLKYRLTYLSEAVVNWCPALGTVLANDEVKDGFSERGGYPVERKKMKQWMMRITAFAERLLAGLDKIDWSESLKESQRNWIGKSYGAELGFRVVRPFSPNLSPSPEGKDFKAPSPLGRGGVGQKTPLFETANKEKWKYLKEFGRNNRKNPTEAEKLIWEALRGDKLEVNFRRQHAIDDFIVDFVCLSKNLVIEIDGEVHDIPEQKEYDEARSEVLKELGYTELRFKNKEVLENIGSVIDKIKEKLNTPSPLGRAGVGQEGGGADLTLTVFTTRIDTTFGVTFVSIAPEHELIPTLTSPEQKAAVEEYVNKAKNRSERDRMADIKTVSGVFTGSYVINPFSGEKIELWIADYVLAGYGTGVVMAVPSSDDRDFRFAKHFNLPIVCVIEGTEEMEDPTEKKKGKMINSGFLNGLESDEAIQVAIKFAEEKEIGKGKINFRMRDAVFSRQRYWGEPVPVYFKDGIPYLLDNNELPLILPEIDEYKPTENGEPPLGRAKDWKYTPSPMGRAGVGHNSSSQQERGQGVGLYPYELSTMPGWAGSSWYFLRYMDAQNEKEFVSKEAVNYWKSVDLYIGGTEHAVGHLLYSRFWNLALYDLGFIGHDEPFQKLINQGMIQGESALAYRISGTNKFVSIGLKDQYEVAEIHVDVNIVENNILDIEAFKQWRPDLADAEFVLENGKYICGELVEKMSKSKYNVVNPDLIIDKYGADTLRLYEMFLGPLEQSKPWSTKGIDGTYKFLRKLWKLFYDDKGNLNVSAAEPTKAEYKTLHKTIKKVAEDIERYSFNTTVSAFMICVNELTDLKCNKAKILNDLLIILSPYAPHIAEELWAKLGHANSITQATFPEFNEEYLKESAFEYPISINGKMRTKMEFPVDKPIKEIEEEVLNSEVVKKWAEGKPIKKVIVVPNKIVNVVV